MAKFEYGKAYERYPIEEEERWELSNGLGILQVHDIYHELPDFLLQADMIISDLPYNTQMINGYYTKAEIEQEVKKQFDSFLSTFFKRVDEINPHTILIEIGKQNVKKVEEYIKARFESVEVIESTYYKKHRCYFVRGSNFARSPYDYNGLDEMDVIRVACEKESFECVADLLMGQGAVAVSSYQAKKKFVGTELNKKRLAVTIEKIAQLGGKWEKERV